MRRILHLLLPLTLLLPLFSPVSALMFEPPEESTQGYTMELVMPKYEMVAAQGSFGGFPFQFFSEGRVLRGDEQIPRLEFFKLLHPHLKTLPSRDVALSIPDMPSVHPDYATVQLALQTGAATLPNGKDFLPYHPIRRIDAAQLLLRLGDKEPSLPGVHFLDVPETSPYFSTVQAAVMRGYMQGYPNGQMLPERNLTYEEAYALLRKAGYLPEDAHYIPGEVPHLVAYVGVERQRHKGDTPLELTYSTLYAGNQSHSYSVYVNTRWFRSQHFSLSTDRYALFGDDAQRITWEKVDAAREHPTDVQLWEGAFIRPSIGKTTLTFGDHLYINGNYVGTHFGIDYAAPTGTPLHASNRGKVVLAEYLPAFGYTVILDHGMGIFTMYLHMDRIDLPVGSMADKGQQIGTIGNTGISTGPHVHFTFFAHDTIVDHEGWYAGYWQ